MAKLSKLAWVAIGIISIIGVVIVIVLMCCLIQWCKGDGDEYDEGCGSCWRGGEGRSSYQDRQQND
ncbi:hypothetical protein BU23DRAFT_8535 [Bimuria novae-zelandiae CBS 107.79]|uniref:Transmembrane protein n=1 Tax=Bimuria novae-zelandiae CBS 107.79 TaxID=1447943 RepID=A0A6A5VV14_9PLEO|nr:hypothetical protein BU23DRAFT_8535 [Bimuria novae-zelandiae CBS 107.79]